MDSHREQKCIREAILYDENDHIATTMWENLLEEISEETKYLFQNIFLKGFYGLKLTTTRVTMVSSENYGDSCYCQLVVVVLLHTPTRYIHYLYGVEKGT